MILDDYTSHVDFNLNWSNSSYNSNFTTFYIPKSLQTYLHDTYNITLNPYNNYWTLSNYKYFIIFGNDLTTNTSSNYNYNLLKLSTDIKDSSNQNYCVSSYYIVRALVIEKETYKTNYDTIFFCPPTSLKNKMLSDYYTEIKFGVGYQQFELGTTYYDDLIKTNKQVDIIITMFYIMIPLLLFIFTIKIFRKGLFK